MDDDSSDEGSDDDEQSANVPSPADEGAAAAPNPAIPDAGDEAEQPAVRTPRNATPAPTAVIADHDISLAGDPARSLLNIVRQFVEGLNPEDTTTHADFIRFVTKHMFFPSIEANPLRTILSPQEINFLLGKIAPLPAPSAVFASALEERMQLMAADADFWEFPAFPTETRMSKKDRDAWLYVDTVMRYM